MSIIGFNRDSPAAKAPTKTKPPLIVRLFNILGMLSLVAGVVVTVFSLGAFNPTSFISGIAGVFFGILFLGLAEFFEQIARIASATEETARLLRDQRPPF